MKRCSCMSPSPCWSLAWYEVILDRLTDTHSVSVWYWKQTPVKARGEEREMVISEVICSAGDCLSRLGGGSRWDWSGVVWWNSENGAKQTGENVRGNLWGGRGSERRGDERRERRYWLKCRIVSAGWGISVWWAECSGVTYPGWRLGTTHTALSHLGAQKYQANHQDHTQLSDEIIISPSWK